MKKITLSIMLFTCIGFIACKKESTAKQPTTQDKLLGKWNLISVDINDYFSGVAHPYIYTYAPGDYMDFRNDGKLYGRFIGAYDTVAYAIISDSKIWIDTPADVYDIKSMTAKDMQLYTKTIYNVTDYSESTVKLNR